MELDDDRTIFGSFTLIDKENNIILTNAREVTKSGQFNSDLCRYPEEERWIGIVMVPRHKVKAVYE